MLGSMVQGQKRFCAHLIGSDKVYLFRHLALSNDSKCSGYRFYGLQRGIKCEIRASLDGKGDIQMAIRKQFLDVKPANPELEALLAAAKGRKVTTEELHEQRISFAFGNAPDSEHITKDSVRAASNSLLIAE